MSTAVPTIPTLRIKRPSATHLPTHADDHQPANARTAKTVPPSTQAHHPIWKAVIGDPSSIGAEQRGACGRFAQQQLRVPMVR